MMPDRYDELRKRLAVEQLKPQMGQEPTELFTQDDIDIEGIPPVAQEQPSPAPESPARNPSGMDAQSAMYIGDLAASAGPGLLSLLGGGSPAVVSNLMDKGNKYAQNRGAQEEITKANTSVIDDNGEPLNVRTRDAMGKKPYYPSRSGSLSNLGSVVSGVPANMFNPKTGDRAKVQQYKDGTAFRYGTKIPITDIGDWQQDLGVANATGTDVYGTKTQDQYNKNQPSGMTRVKTTQGLGEYMGHIPQKEAESRLKDANKSKVKTAESIATLQELKAHRNTLATTNDSMTFSIAMGNILRTVEKRLSDEEQQRFLGNDYRGILGNASNYIQGKMGIIPQSLRNGVVEAADYIEAREKGRLKANSSSYTTKQGLNQKGRDTVDRTSGQDTESTKKVDWKNKLKDL